MKKILLISLLLTSTVRADQLVEAVKHPMVAWLPIPVYYVKVNDPKKVTYVIMPQYKHEDNIIPSSTLSDTRHQVDAPFGNKVKYITNDGQVHSIDFVSVEE